MENHSPRLLAVTSCRHRHRRRQTDRNLTSRSIRDREGRLPFADDRMRGPGAGSRGCFGRLPRSGIPAGLAIGMCVPAGQSGAVANLPFGDRVASPLGSLNRGIGRLCQGPISNRHELGFRSGPRPAFRPAPVPPRSAAEHRARRANGTAVPHYHPRLTSTVGCPWDSALHGPAPAQSIRPVRCIVQWLRESGCSVLPRPRRHRQSGAPPCTPPKGIR